MTETKLSSYDEYLIYANLIMKQNPDVLFLIQSDETEFIEFISDKFPNNSFYFKDEIRHVKKCNSTVDILMCEKNFIFSKYYLAITMIMSKCKYIVCGSGNCSVWIMLFRGNNNNVYQYSNGKWLHHNDNQWMFIANEGDIVSDIKLGTHIRYGAEGFGWIERISLHDCFQVNNMYFNYDPAPNTKKVLQKFISCVNTTDTPSSNIRNAALSHLK